MTISKAISKIDKFALYENSVQSPDYHAEWFVHVYKELRGTYPRHLREDFCGTARLSAEWVKRNRNNTAIAIDLDPEPLAYGKKHHWRTLSAEQRKRLQLLNDNVLSITQPKVDLLIACNFSYCIFKERETLVRYLRGCMRSLGKNGMAILDLAGGPGMIAPMRERKTAKAPKIGKFVYTWHQKSFDPITHDAQYSIHFKLKNGIQINDAFTYDWRLWTIPEIRDAMKEAGFRKTCVFWETEHKGQGTGEYLQADHGDNAYAWVAYIVGMA
ncbi:class I SAM-dependent methyltransferase [Bdellovibrionota bacterium FG-1]